MKVTLHCDNDDVKVNKVNSTWLHIVLDDDVRIAIRRRKALKLIPLLEAITTEQNKDLQEWRQKHGESFMRAAKGATGD